MKTITSKTFLLSLLLSAFAPFSTFAEAPYTSFDDAVKALCKKHGIDANHAHKPKQAPSKNMQLDEPTTDRSCTPHCDKKEEKCKVKEKEQGFYKNRLEILDAKVQSVVDQGLTVGAYTTACVKESCDGFKSHNFFAGVENVTSQKPFTGDTIIRLASMSKFLGTVGFLKLIDKGLITGFEPLADFIPEFANTQVLETFTPSACVTLGVDPIATLNGFPTVTITETAHGRSTGDFIGIQNATAVDGITANQINSIYQITVTGVNTYQITVSSNANATTTGGGNAVMVCTLTSGVQQSVLLGITYYYILQPLDRPILLYHVMTHSLGYSYWVGALGLSFGFAENPTLRNTQAGIYSALQIPMGFPDPSLPLSSQTILQWAPAIAQVPLLFQPGTNWSYGPTLSILGALIEIIDPAHRDLETYMQEEVFQPIGMESTGFFIQNVAPDRAEKLARIMTLYTFPFGPGIAIPVSIIPGLEFFDDYFYGLSESKTLALIDGGIYSTPRDYLKFIKMMLNNGFTKNEESILSPAMISYLSENHTLENSIFNILDVTPNVLTPGKWAKWGLGVGVTTGATMGIAGGVPLICSSTRTIGWDGFFLTNYSIDLGNKVGVSTGTNVLGLAAGNQIISISSLNYSALKFVNPNNENSSGNNPEVATNPT